MYREYFVMKTEKLYQSSNYLFLFRINVSDEQITQYAAETESRRKDIVKLLGYEAETIKRKPIYIIDESEDVNMHMGKANAQCIRIFINELRDIYANLNLVIHEETHFLLFNMYPQISPFLSEGIAEYICWKQTKRTKPKEFFQNMKYVHEITSEMILTVDNWMKRYSSQGIWIYGIACLYIECMLGDRYTVKDILEEIYVRENSDIIEKTLLSCQKKQWTDTGGA